LRLLKTVKDAGAAIDLSGILLTLPPGDSPGAIGEEEIRALLGSAVLPQTTPYDPEVGRSLLLGKTVIESSPAAPATRAFRALALELGVADEAAPAVPEHDAIEAAEPTLIFERPAPEPPPQAPPVVAPPELTI